MRGEFAITYHLIGSGIFSPLWENRQLLSGEQTSPELGIYNPFSILDFDFAIYIGADTSDTDLHLYLGWFMAVRQNLVPSKVHM